ncbi:HlyD family secretion protein [Pseudarcicella hirudinis]|uniref:HlyD family secretion protein n=2 Tax=Pseudarcicella hirudinis TaxID=1079859 RepID=A0A1I5MT30_9BACT|nr:HlyD family efflux transporter periplasmic adaptor subunit [Pseudarcicella hirudinis]SFP12116.1 HlyD family secretion protein [Pseudarcicella hirudinis]
MKYSIILALSSLLFLASCEKKEDYDASGNFEADEVIVSSQQNGELLSFSANEGDALKAGTLVGQIDVTLPKLQKEQVEASIQAIAQKTGSPKEQIELINKQLAVQQAQMDQQLRERTRMQNLVKADAATRKQLDDINARIEQLEREMLATRQQMKLNTTNVSTQNRGILSEQAPLKVSARQYQEQINRGEIVNPVSGVVLTKYALKGEITAIGKPLYKIANIDTLFLKAYLTGDKLSQIRLGQQVSIRIDQGEKDYKSYQGIITWISAKSEFTPKTIQTKNERANLVYAFKVRVKNDGYLKIGMYGEVILNKAQEQK